MARPLGGGKGGGVRAWRLKFFYSKYKKNPNKNPSKNAATKLKGGKALVARDEDPVLAKNRIRGSVPHTKGDF